MREIALCDRRSRASSARHFHSAPESPRMPVGQDIVFRGLPSAATQRRAILWYGRRGPSKIDTSIYVIIKALLDVREYIDAAGRSPFTKWLRALNVHAAAKVTTALERIANGNLSNVKTVGSGVLEYKIDFGPGYRVYFGRDGDRLIILLAGGTKKSQQKDIRQAKVNWEDYRNRKA
jgi:putative addiction module killer protein